MHTIDRLARGRFWRPVWGLASGWSAAKFRLKAGLQRGDLLEFHRQAVFIPGSSRQAGRDVGSGERRGSQGVTSCIALGMLCLVDSEIF
jgi:hypothetical protein